VQDSTGWPALSGAGGWRAQILLDLARSNAR
jgi:hypothetical protein